MSKSNRTPSRHRSPATVPPTAPPTAPTIILPSAAIARSLQPTPAVPVRLNTSVSQSSASEETSRSQSSKRPRHTPAQPQPGPESPTQTESQTTRSAPKKFRTNADASAAANSKLKHIKEASLSSIDRDLRKLSSEVQGFKETLTVLTTHQAQTANRLQHILGVLKEIQESRDTERSRPLTSNSVQFQLLLADDVDDIARLWLDLIASEPETNYLLQAHNGTFNVRASSDCLDSPLLVFALTMLGIRRETSSQIRKEVGKLFKQSLRRSKRTLTSKGSRFSSFHRGTARLNYTMQFDLLSQYFDLQHPASLKIEDFFEFGKKRLIPQDSVRNISNQPNHTEETEQSSFGTVFDTLPDNDSGTDFSFA